MDAVNKKESNLGYISLIIAILAIIVYFGAYFMDMEMALFLLLTLAGAFLGFVLGIVGIFLSITKKNIGKRMLIFGVLLNLIFIAYVVINFFGVMGGA